LFFYEREVTELKILAIIGSPRMNGNTYKAVYEIEKELEARDNDIKFEYVQLSRIDLKPCRGCFACIEKGEERCPLKDDRESLELKMKQVDAVIFASPVYTYNVSWIMKNFQDRFAYRCHRPDFHGKKAMVVVTTGAVGLKFASFLLSSTMGSMGFITCAKAGVTFAPAHESDVKRQQREQNKLIRQAEVFYNKLMDTKPVKPSLIKLLTFKKQQKAFFQAPKDLADYKFWKEKGWFEKKTAYYYEVKIGSISKMLAKIFT
jgi:multimeric flavodoxin WrbA